MPEPCQIYGAVLVAINRPTPVVPLNFFEQRWGVPRRFSIYIKLKSNMIPSTKETKKKAKPTTAANGNGSSRSGAGLGRNGNGAHAKIPENDSLLEDKDLLRIL